LQQGERFRIVDPPSLPTETGLSQSPEVLWIGLGIGLALGAVVAGAFEMMDDRIHDEKELQKLLPVPVISEIPAHGSEAEEQTEAQAVVAGLGDSGFRICYDFAGVGLQLLARLAIIHVQSLLQLEAQSVRDHSRSFVPVSHREAQRSLGRPVLRRQAAQRVCGLTGEVGTGKTLLLRCLLQLLKSKAMTSSTPTCSTAGCRRSNSCSTSPAIWDFPPPARTRVNCCSRLRGYVIARGQKKLTTVLVVDEAHHLSTEILEEIRLLTNLETADEKLLQILLVGPARTGRQTGLGRVAAVEAESRAAFPSGGARSRTKPRDTSSAGFSWREVPTPRRCFPRKRLRRSTGTPGEFRG
jgi:hypothetical protein